VHPSARRACDNVRAMLWYFAIGVIFAIVAVVIILRMR
jgi:hypothetical protein